MGIGTLHSNKRVPKLVKIPDYNVSIPLNNAIQILNLHKILRVIFTCLLILSLFRLGMSIYLYPRIANASDLLYMLVQGLRVDIVTVGYFFLIPALCAVWLKEGKSSRFFSRILSLWLIVSFTVLIFMEVVTPEFIREYDIRPNRIFLDYLIYPKEVSSMLWEGYKPAIVLSLFALIVAVIFSRRLLMFRSVNRPSSASVKTLRQRILVSIFILILGFMGIRSSLQHRPFNPSMVFFSNDNLVNSLVLNSTYSVLFAMYNSGSEQSAFDLYGKMDEKKIIEKVREAATLRSEESNRFVSYQIPTQRLHVSTYTGRPKNIVILLQESLGARHVGGLGGAKLTPNLDKLLEEGWNFTNAYATGTRSVRGIEAVFTGFSPGPSRSVVKLNKSQTGFFSIASLLKQKNYTTQFIYGGESHFDNMKSFFLGNGIDDIHDLPTFNNPRYVGSWGASDEDLYFEAHQEFERMQAAGKPFFSLVFTTSNHTPFDFPEGCLERLEHGEHTMENAIRYSDCALGQFIENAKSSTYWEDTVFLLIADHDSRSIGSDSVPIGHFRIPALLFGNGIEPKLDERLVSQIDFPPTLLSLAGVSAYHPMIGFDLTHDVPDNKQRAMLQYNENFAWLTKQEAVVLRPNLDPAIFRHDGYHLMEEIETSSMSNLVELARANALWSSLAYSKAFYRDASFEYKPCCEFNQ